MKAIIGIDVRGNYKPAIHLLARLKFERTEALLTHVVDPTMAFLPAAFPVPANLEGDFLRASESAGRVALDDARVEACSRDISCHQTLRVGNPADTLSLIAEESGADMVAVNADRGSMWSTSFLGSVSRGLAIGCKASVLVAKGAVIEKRPMRIVLATDHSTTADRWIKKFLGWKPGNISRIDVVTAYDVSNHELDILERTLPNADAMIEGHLRDRNAALVKRLEEAGYKVEAHVGRGRINDVIRATMQDTQADLLVLGAQGHGFLERLRIGSTALHQVVAEPYPVLIVRP